MLCYVLQVDFPTRPVSRGRALRSAGPMELWPSCVSPEPTETIYAGLARETAAQYTKARRRFRIRYKYYSEYLW